MHVKEAQDYPSTSYESWVYRLCELSRTSLVYPRQLKATLDITLVLNTPIFPFYFTDSDTNEVILSLSDATDISCLIQRFNFHDVGTRTHTLYCSNAQADLIQGSDLISLPNFPLCLCHIGNYHWVGMLLQDASVSSLIPIPYTRVLRE